VRVSEQARQLGVAGHHLALQGDRCLGDRFDQVLRGADHQLEVTSLAGSLQPVGVVRDRASGVLLESFGADQVELHLRFLSATKLLS